jgi:sepiapterin reductase
MESPEFLKKFTVLVTGAGKGLGRAVVEEFLERKDTFPELQIALSARTPGDLEGLADQLRSRGADVLLIPGDLTLDPVGPIHSVCNRWGRLDALIHCAGVGRFGDFGSYTADDLRFVMNTNIEATFLLLQEAFNRMRQQEIHGGLRGQIQVITSVAAERPFEHSAVYCMSKYAQRGLLEVMRLPAYRDLIRILEVRSGAAFTPMWGSVDPGMRARMMDARDVARPMMDALMSHPAASIELLTIRPIRGDL